MDFACGSTRLPSRLDPRPGGSTIASWLNRRTCAPTTAHAAPRCFLSPAAQLPAPRIYSLIPGRRRRIASSHGPWAVCLGCPLPCQIKPGPNVAAAVIGVQQEAGLGWQGLLVLPARHVLSLTWPASAVSHLPLAMDVQSGLLAVVPDQTRPQRRCRCHQRAAGGRSWAGTDHGWYSRRVVFLEGLVPVVLAFARACSAGPSPVWRIASVTWPRRSRGHRTERGPTAGRHHWEAPSALPAVCTSRAHRARSSLTT
jgi:hypothetical protein